MSKEAEILRKCVSGHDEYTCAKIKEIEEGHVSQVSQSYKSGS